MRPAERAVFDVTPILNSMTCRRFKKKRTASFAKSHITRRGRDGMYLVLLLVSRYPVYRVLATAVPACSPTQELFGEGLLTFT